MLNNKKEITKEDIREFVSKAQKYILKNADIEKLNTTFNFSFNFLEHFNKSFYGKKYNLQKVNKMYQDALLFTSPFFEAGYFPKSDDIILCLNKMISLNDSHVYSSLVTTIFHEYRHAMQHNNLNNSFESIIFQMEESKSNLGYTFTHDLWFSEIDADMFALKNALLFVDENPSLFSKEELAYLKNKAIKKYILFEEYDYDNLFEQYSIHMLKNQKKENAEWINIFYNSNGYIRPLDELLDDQRLLQVDPKFVRKFITSYVYNNNNDIKKCDEHSLEFLHSSFLKERDSSLKFIQNSKNLIDYRKQSFITKERLDYNFRKRMAKIQFYTKQINELENLLANSKMKNTGYKRFRNGFVNLISVIITFIIVLIILFVNIAR